MNKIIFMLVMAAIVLMSGCIGETDIIRGNEFVFEIEENNTNLAPNVAGHPTGTGERISGVTYWANSTPIELHVYAHADTATQALNLSLQINGTVVQQIQLRPITAPENTYAPMTAIIPKGANYSVTITNYHHYEWREYRVISGSSNYNWNEEYETELGLKVNKSGDTMSGTLVVQNITNTDYININATSGIILDAQKSNFEINSGVYYRYNGSLKIIYYPGNPFVSEFTQFTTPMEYTNDSEHYGNNITGVYNLNMTGGVKISSLAGTGNDYACIDANGVIYRSDSAC